MWIEPSRPPVTAVESPRSGMALSTWHHQEVLWFWVIVLVVIIGAIAVVASGRGGSMAEVYDDRPDVALPTGRPLTAADVRSIRFNTGVRGYRMDEVDALLARIEADLIEREDDGPTARTDSDPFSEAERDGDTT